MTNKEILDIAMQQSAYDLNAKASDFLLDTNVFVKFDYVFCSANIYIHNLLIVIWINGNNTCNMHYNTFVPGSASFLQRNSFLV